MTSKIIIIILSFMMVIACGRKGPPVYKEINENKAFKNVAILTFKI